MSAPLPGDRSFDWEGFYNRMAERFGTMLPNMSPELAAQCRPHEGRWVCTMGDEVVSVGDTAWDAVQAAPDVSEPEWCFPVHFDA